MKLIIHAGLFAMGTVEVDTETGKWAMLTEPLINADQSISSGQSIDPAEAMKAGNVVLAVLNQAVAQWILKSAGLDAKVVAPEPIPLVNVVNKKASA